jgi:iron complex transport system substrate-binding protein
MRAGHFGARIVIVLCSWLAACGELEQADVSHTVATRIVTLAPNLTELVFDAGAGASLVGVSAYSDYPVEALSLPLVGDAFMIDQEQLALLQPDLLLVWQSGTPVHVVDQLARAGYRVEVIRTRSLDDIATALVRIGELTGHVEQAAQAAKSYREGLQSLADRYRSDDSLRVFYQISKRPLYTVNGEHYVSELIETCGGTNVFAGLGDLAPTVDVEAVVELDPEVMLASTDAGEDAFTVWGRWPHVAANRYGNHFLMPADEVGRATTRLIVAGEALCAALQTARERKMSANKAP